MPDISEREFDDRLALVTGLLEKLIQVNGFFITAGYGTFFGIWAIARDDLDLHIQLWSCLLLLMSAAVFVGWHLYCVMSINLVMKGAAQPPAEGWAGDVIAALRKKILAIIPRWGIPITLLAAALAAVGVATLAVGLLRAL